MFIAIFLVVSLMVFMVDMILLIILGILSWVQGIHRSTRPRRRRALPVLDDPRPITFFDDEG